MMPMTYCHISYYKLHLLKQKFSGVLFYCTEKKNQVGKLSRSTVRVQYVCI